MFDFSPQEVPVETESETRRNLRELSRLLRHPEEWPEGHRWDFREELLPTNCGSVVCAVGLWKVAKKSRTPWEDLGVGRNGGEHPGLRPAFTIEYRAIPESPVYGVPYKNINPSMVADRIDQYLEQYVEEKK